MAVGIVMAGLGIAQSIMGGRAPKTQAKADAAYARQLAIHNNEKYRRNVEYQYDLARWQNDNYYQNAATSADNARKQYSTILEQADQMRDQTLFQMEAAGRQADKAESFVRAAASETGTEGASVRLARQEIRKAEAEYRMIGFKNLKNALRQSEREMAVVQARAQGSVNQAIPAPRAPIDPAAPIQAVQQPSMMPYLMQAGSAALGAAASFQSLQTAQMGVDMKAVQSGMMPVSAFNETYNVIYSATGTH